MGRSGALRFAAWLATVAVLRVDVTVVVSNNFHAATRLSTSPFSTVRSTTTTNEHLKLGDAEKYWAPRLPSGVRIAFRMRDYAKDEFRFQSDELCYNNAKDIHRNHGRTSHLPPTLTDVRSEREWEGGFSFDHDEVGRGGRYLDFSTSVSTDLKILFLGDSVAEQFGRAFDLASTVELHTDPKADNPNRVVHNYFRVYGEVRACLFATAPVRGGGAVGMWRVVKLLSMSRRGFDVCNSKAGGWNDAQLAMIRDQRYRVPATSNANETELAGNITTETIGNFDAVVLRIQLGWMGPGEITESALRETIMLCRDYLGAQTVVVMTINFTNDVHTPHQWAWALETNDKLREMARSFNRNETEYKSKFRVQIMEFANFTTQVLWANARTIRAPDGYAFEYPDLQLRPPNSSVPNYEIGADFLFDRFQPWHRNDHHPQSMPSVCGRMTDMFIDPKGRGVRRNCTRNAIMYDGLHWCMSSVGPRYHAGLSCLLGCAYNRENKEGITSVEDDNIQREQCERSCNDQFMSLLPINEAWFEKDSILYSVLP